MKLIIVGETTDLTCTEHYIKEFSRLDFIDLHNTSFRAPHECNSFATLIMDISLTDDNVAQYEWLLTILDDVNKIENMEDLNKFISVLRSDLEKALKTKGNEDKKENKENEKI